MLTDANHLYTAAMSTISGCLTLIDATQPDYPIVFANTAFLILSGYSTEEIVGRNCRFLQGPDTDRVVVQEIREAVAAGLPIRREILNYRKDGTSFWNDLVIEPVRSPAGIVTGYVGVQHDVTERKQLEAANLEAEQRFLNIASSVPGYLFRRVMSPSEEISYPYLSCSVFRILGLSDDTGWEDLLTLHMSAIDRERALAEMVESGRTVTPHRAEYRMTSSTGEDHWFRSQSVPHLQPNGDVVWDGMAVDITAERASAAQIAFLSGHDQMTSLPSRAMFSASLVGAVSTVSAKDLQTALFCLDLDGFQTVNNAHGQTFGDMIMRRVAVRLKEFSTRHGGSAARLGGDEFAVLLPNLPLVPPVEDLAAALCVEIGRPMLINEMQTYVQASIGAACFPHLSDVSQVAAADDWATELVGRAELALQSAKREGVGLYRVYSQESDDRVRDLPALRKSLDQAISDEQFTLYYQPINDLASGRIVGAEALLRWDHPKLGMQRPDLFIPLAESTGLIVPLGAWVLQAAMRQAQAWRSAGLPPIRVSVNVSSIQLQRPGFLAMVAEALRATGADAHQFELELTEGTLLETAVEVKSQLQALKDLGFTLAIDDFGTGHATFKYLRDFPIDKLKIDQTFVRKLVIDSSDASIIRAMISLARDLRLTVVAEGIETAMQRDFLLEEGCATGQGYLFSIPLSSEDFGWLLKEGSMLPMRPALHETGEEVTP